MNSENSLAFAKQLDKEDPLKDLRNRFLFPQHNGKDCIYFTGNSLGLQPKNTSTEIQNVLDNWAALAVEGHFKGDSPWMHFHDQLTKVSSNIVGCLPEEVVIMNSLTVNLHLMMVSFYTPTKQRYKIICESKAFPSDQYAFESQARFHACLPDRQGFDPAKAIVEVHPRSGEHTLRTEDIIAMIEKHSDDTALVLFSGINYYTGQCFDVKAITNAAHKAGAYAGFDLAHAAGNVELKLHEWDVDFACWCTYKYFNSGPGAVSGCYIHERFATDKTFPRFAGWWGNNKQTRFKMEREFDAVPSAEGWQLSTPPALLLAAYKASLDIFEEAGIENIHKKRKMLTAYLHFILNDLNQKNKEKVIEIITPSNEEERGCQVSMFMHKNGKEIFNALTEEGVIADWREPNVIRVAPVPLYNTYEDVWHFGNIIEKILQ
jgi:kynureninase